MGKPWIGVDLDGTLARTDDERWAKYGDEFVGPPVEKMVERVKKWLQQGIEVRIVTARVSLEEKYSERVRRPIQAWCLIHIGQILPITNEKDHNMIQLWDDRAIQVIENTGERADGKEE
jgi:hypothetical protein